MPDAQHSSKQLSTLSGIDTQRLYDVLVAGELNVDIILNGMSTFPHIGKEIIAPEMTITLGSSSAIFASNLSTLGTSVAFSGMLSHDQFGELVLATLQTKGVNTDHIVFSPDRGTGATIALSFGEDRAMVTYPGAMSLFGADHITDGLLGRCRHLHVSSIFLSPRLKQDILVLFKKAKSLGLTTSLDPQWDPEEKWDINFKELLPYVDVFIPNSKELISITGVHDLTEAAEKLRPFARILIVKNGRDGALMFSGKESVHQPAFLNDQVVDSIGAGDSFGAGFIHSFIQGKELRDCLEFAAVIGAINTTRAGGTSAFESLEIVKNIAESRFNFKWS